MIKRLVLAIALLLSASLLVAAEDRDVILTADGTIFTVEAVAANTPDLQTASGTVLRLTVHRADQEKVFYVPGSTAGGVSSSPSLAFDSDGNTLFIFWQNMPNLMSSELLFCSYQDGVFSPATSIEDAPLRFRYNLNIAVTRSVEDTTDGIVSRKPMLLVHAAWWDETGYGETARYAQLAIRDGKVQSMERMDLSSLFPSRPGTEPAVLPADFDRDLFRHPTMIETPAHDAVEAVFANTSVNRMYRVTIKPVTENGVLRVPIGVSGREMPPPGGFNREVSSTVSFMASSSSERVVLYSRSDRSIRYSMFKDGTWSDTVTIPVTETLSGELGMQALRRLASE